MSGRFRAGAGAWPGLGGRRAGGGRREPAVDLFEFGAVLGVVPRWVRRDSFQGGAYSGEALPGGGGRGGLLDLVAGSVEDLGAIAGDDGR